VRPLSLPPPLPMEFFFLYAETRASSRGRDGRSASVHVACRVATNRRMFRIRSEKIRTARSLARSLARLLAARKTASPREWRGGEEERHSLSSASAVLPVIIIQAHSSCGRSGHRCDVRAAGSAEGERP